MSKSWENKSLSKQIKSSLNTSDLSLKSQRCSVFLWLHHKEFNGSLSERSLPFPLHAFIWNDGQDSERSTLKRPPCCESNWFRIRLKAALQTPNRRFKRVIPFDLCDVPPRSTGKTQGSDASFAVNRSLKSKLIPDIEAPPRRLLLRPNV